MATDVRRFIEDLQNNHPIGSGFAHLEQMPAQKARFQDADPPLDQALTQALAASGIKRLYTHQAQALALAREGRDLMVATPTASGKTLIYALPVLESLMAQSRAHALFLFPLKALEQDQLKALNELALLAGMGPVAAVYDGDTPQSQRRKLRSDPPSILISNPDMVHAGICAYPGHWAGFLANLRYIIIDEVHTYRGIFGGHVVQVLRRLLRLAARAGSRPQFLLSSATIANPTEHAGALTGREFALDQVIKESGAPVAGRFFALINPPGAPSTTAAFLLAKAVRAGLAAICFTKSRIHTELIHAWVTRQNPDLAGLVAGYRAGFLPEERRRIERALALGKLAGVVSTSALEMGIDIGGLDLCILVGYPGSQINTWQRGGRVGRGGRPSAIFMVAGPDALDQWLTSHPREFLAKPVEAAILDPDNPEIVGPHLVCAAAEEPLSPEEEHFELARHGRVIEELIASGQLLRDAQGVRLFASRKRPQRFVDLRGAGDSYAILDPGGRVVGSLDGVRVFKEGYPGAVYLHQTRTYIVRELDLPGRKVRVNPARADYYTRARSEKETRILEETGRRPAANFLVRKGRLKVTEQVVGYERRRLQGQDLLGVFPLDLPPLTFETRGLWIDIEDAMRCLVEGAGLHFMGSIHALEHAAIALLPLFVLCDRGDLGGISIPLHPQTGKAGVFIYDGVPGGVGLADQGYQLIEELLLKVEGLLDSCDCLEGCPACVYSPKCGSGNKPLDKAGALLLTRALLGKEDIAVEPGPPPAILVVDSAESPLPSGEICYGVLDLETQRLASEVGGWANSHLMRVSVAVLYDGRNGSFQSFAEEGVPRLLETLAQMEMVVGFNLKRFDYKVLSAYSTADLQRLPTLDLLEEVMRQLGHRLSLQSLAEASLGAAKSADGLQAVQWWREGRLDDLREYCQKDVSLTRDLLFFGQERGHLLYTRKDGATLRIPVDWSWPALRKRLGKQARQGGPGLRI